MLQSGSDASYSLRITCAGQRLHLMGSGAVVKNKLLGEKGGLYISGVSYRLDENGDLTTLRLRRRKNECGSPDM